MKVRAEVPDFQENSSWKLGSLDGQGISTASELDPFVISAPNATQKVYNSKVTYEAPITISEVMLKQAFTSPSEMGRFIAMIENRIQLKMTLSTDALIMRTINNLIGLKVSKNQNVVNLLREYNAGKLSSDEAPLTAAQALRSTDFLRFATKTIALYKDYLKTASNKYNGSGDYITFTPEDRLKFVALSEFAKDMETYLYADTYHNEFVKMSGYSTVPYWQSQGTGMDDFEVRSGIKVVVEGSEDGSIVEQSGIVAVMFDEEAAAVVNENYRITSQYNPRGEYTNYFYKWDAGYMNDDFENCVVFVLQDEDATTGSIPANFTIAPRTDLTYGVDPDSYQSLTINGTTGAITGTLTKDTATDAWTTKWGKGYFIAIDFGGTAATSDVQVGINPTAGSGMINLEPSSAYGDFALFYLGNPAAGSTLNTKLQVRVDGKLYAYSLSSLTLA